MRQHLARVRVCLHLHAKFYDFAVMRAHKSIINCRDRTCFALDRKLRAPPICNQDVVAGKGDL